MKGSMNMARDRNNDGQFRQKRGDTHVGTIERMYNVDFGVRSDMHVDTLRQQFGVTSIEDLVNIARDQ
jgi:hypothetical protein